MTTLTIPTDSVLAQQHEDIDPTVRMNVYSSWRMTGGNVPRLGDLMRVAQVMANNGLDPRDNSILEVGLLLTPAEYAQLADHVGKLVVKGSRRRR